MPPRTIPTVVVDQGQDSWTSQLIQSFPTSWVDPAALQPDINPSTDKKGGWWSLFNAIAGNLEIINQQLIYGWKASRIATAIDVELDLVSHDLYGDQLPRLPGEPDDSFRRRIQASLFLPYTTREGFIICLTRLTGYAPRLIEPWNTGDTGGYDWSCYDADSASNPSLYGDPGMRYQAAVIAVLPPVIFGGVAVAIWGYDAGAAYDAQTGVYWEPIRGLFSSQAELDALINRIRAYGTTIWRKYLAVPLISWIVGQNYGINAGVFSGSISVQPFSGPYFAFCSCSWNAIICVPTTNTSGFTWSANQAAPANASQLYTICIPWTVQGAGSVPLSPGVNSVTINVPADAPTNRLIVTPTWNSTVYISALTDTTVTLSFGTSAPTGAALNIYWMPSANSALLPVPLESNFIAVAAPAGNIMPFCTPSWNTQVAVSLQGGQIIYKFNTPPPPNAFIQWAALQV